MKKRSVFRRLWVIPLAAALLAGCAAGGQDEAAQETSSAATAETVAVALEAPLPADEEEAQEDVILIHPQPVPEDLPESCPLCGGMMEDRRLDTREGGLAVRDCIHEAYGEDYHFPNYAVYQRICTECGEWQSDTWQTYTGADRVECHGYQ